VKNARVKGRVEGKTGHGTCRCLSLILYNNDDVYERGTMTTTPQEHHAVDRADVTLLISLAHAETPYERGFLRGMKAKLQHTRKSWKDVYMTTRQMNALITLTGY